VNGTLVVKLSSSVSPVDHVDLPGGTGRVFCNMIGVAHEKGESLLVLPEGDFGLQLIPCADLASGFKKADSLIKIADLAVAAGICEGFVPRNFHAIVNEGITEILNSKYNECAYGVHVALEGEKTVLVVSENPIEAGSLVECVRAKNNVLVVRAAGFNSDDPFANETWAEYVGALLDQEKPKIKGQLVPKSAPKHVVGMWVGPALSYVNKRGQVSCLVKVDGVEEGTMADLFFTRVGEDKDQPINTGAAVEMWYTGNGNVAVTTFSGKVSDLLDPEAVMAALGIKLEGKTPEAHGNIRVTRKSEAVTA
jgi:hypothetical protein